MTVSSSRDILRAQKEAAARDAPVKPAYEALFKALRIVNTSLIYCVNFITGKNTCQDFLYESFKISVF